MLRFIGVVAMLFFSAVSSTSQAQVQTARYISMIPNSNAYYEYLPKDYSTSNTLYPVIIFIHGVGELGSGTTNSLPTVLRNGPPKLINNHTFPDSFVVNRQTFRFIVISPQFIKWPQPIDIENVIDYVVTNYKVDINKIYVTGLSMGGGATWNYASNYPGYARRVAAIVPVSGAATPNIYRAKIMANANLPVWAFHNKIDPTVTPNNTIGFVTDMNNSLPAPNPLAKMTIFNASGHDSWTATYNPSYRENGKNVYEWMLQYSRDTTIPVTSLPPVANAGSDTTINLPQDSLTLSGNGLNGKGGILTYKWTKISGPDSYHFSDSIISSPLVSKLIPGTYLFSLTVTDNAGKTDADSVMVIVNPANYISIPAKIEAENYAAMFGVQNEKTADTGRGVDVGWIHPGDWLDYNIDVPAAGSYELAFRISSLTLGGKFQILQSDGAILNTVVFPATGGWQTWATIQTLVPLKAGKQTIRIYALQKGWNINWLQFAAPPEKYIKVNLYAGTEAYNNPEWNNWNVGVASARNKQSDSLNYTDGTTSTVSALLSYSQSVADNGINYDSGMAPKEVLRFVSYASGSRTLTISGLSDQKAYTFELYASRAGLNMSSVFTLNNLSDTVNAEDNFTNPILFKSITPDSSGTIVIKLKGLNAYNYLNGFTITESTNGSTSLQRSATPKQALAMITIKDIQPKAASINIHPNPVRENLTLQLENSYIGKVNIRITDMNGVTKKNESITKSLSAATLSVNVKNLSAGMFLLHIQTGKQLITRKFIKL